MRADARDQPRGRAGRQLGSIEYLLDGPSSSGLTNEVFTLVLARNVQKVGFGGGDATETIRVHVVPLDEIEAWLTSKRREGFMISPKIYSALYFVTR
jgi:ADP-ribose pyrophosphatase